MASVEGALGGAVGDGWLQRGKGTLILLLGSGLGKKVFTGETPKILKNSPFKPVGISTFHPFPDSNALKNDESFSAICCQTPLPLSRGDPCWFIPLWL